MTGPNEILFLVFLGVAAPAALVRRNVPGYVVSIVMLAAALVAIFRGADEEVRLARALCFAGSVAITAIIILLTERKS